jgi:hypothetical protein
MDMVLVAFLLTFLPIHGIILCGLVLKRRQLAEERAKAFSLINIARGARTRRGH